MTNPLRSTCLCYLVVFKVSGLFSESLLFNRHHTYFQIISEKTKHNSKQMFLYMLRADIDTQCIFMNLHYSIVL